MLRRNADAGAQGMTQYNFDIFVPELWPDKRCAHVKANSPQEAEQKILRFITASMEKNEVWFDPPTESAAMNECLVPLLNAHVIAGNHGYSLDAMRAAWTHGYDEGVATERERCARICEETWVEPGDLQTCNCQDAADKIRKS